MAAFLLVIYFRKPADSPARQVIYVP